MDRWSNTKVTDEDIRSINSVSRLALIVTDQVFDYWYDPCGKSGFDLKGCFTPRAALALTRLQSIHTDDLDGALTSRRVLNSNSSDFLASALLKEQAGDFDTIKPLSRTVLHRLKGLLWHGELVDRTVLDDIVDATS